jgi:hypothetical protein
LDGLAVNGEEEASGVELSGQPRPGGELGLGCGVLGRIEQLRGAESSRGQNLPILTILTELDDLIDICD